MNEIERLSEIIARTRSIAPSQLEETAESNEPPETPPPTKKRKQCGGYENLDDVRECLNKARGMERLEFTKRPKKIPTSLSQTPPKGSRTSRPPETDSNSHRWCWPIWG
jgi:hypothetical protein